jgi:hypothetical protein
MMKERIILCVGEKELMMVVSFFLSFRWQFSQKEEEEEEVVITVEISDKEPV